MNDESPNVNRDIQEFAKAAAGLPWAISLFGLQQTAGLMNPRVWSDDSGGTTSGIDSVTKAIVEQFSDNLRTTFDIGDRVQGQLIDAIFSTLSPMRRAAPTLPQFGRADDTSMLSAKSRADEEVMLCYTRGQGQFSDDRRYITLNNTIYLLDGRPIGTHQGVWERQFESPRELMQRPNPPSPPLNEPVGPVEKGLIAAQTKAVWAFSDGEVFSVGPAASHLVPFSDGSFLFLVSTAQVVTHGTGRFEGVFGLTQSLGATHVPPGADLFSGENRPFPATTFDTFKLKVVRTSPTRSPNVSVMPVSRSEPSSASATRSRTQPSPPSSKYIEVLGSRMHYIDVGSGDSILFLHGNPVWSYVWRNIVPPVSRTARCIAPDLIGMGKSDKPKIEYGFFDQARYLDGFIQALGLNDITLVMHDWGCILGFFYAMRHSKNVKGMAFMEATFRPFGSWEDFPAPLRPTFQAFRTPDVGFERIVLNNEFVEQLLPRSMIRKLSDAEMEMYRQPFREPTHRKVIWKFANDLPIAGKPADVSKSVTDYASWLKGTRIPKLLLYGEPGAITTEKDVGWARENLKNLTSVCVGKGIHFLQEDQPDAIAREILNWYSTVVKGGRDVSQQ